jgi:multimeric flavodoxin WrbA
MQNRRILFAVELGKTGINLELYRMLEKISISGANYLKNSVGCIIVNSQNEFFTRDVGRRIIFYANMAGCTFPGRAISEATGSLKNLRTYQKKYSRDLLELCHIDCRKVVENLISFKFPRYEKPRILVLHASNYKTSNTYTLWKMVKKHLDQSLIKEIHIENGSVIDCKGCSYKDCKHYSESSNCFYGGIMIEEIYPAVKECDILVMLCPNYNDSISANMAAVINRLTALFRQVKFYDKCFYSIVVSGHSGSDLIAQQLISAVNINKTFVLPGSFALMETANEQGEIYKVEKIEEKAYEFAQNMKTIFT